MPSIFARPNKFNLSHTNALTCDMGKLVPFYVEEVLPGDEFRIRTDAMIRLAPMLAPIYGEVDMYTHYFFVPNRLLWDNWEKFITHGLETGTDSSVKPYLYVSSGSWATTAGVGTLLDYLGYPSGDAAGDAGATVSTMNGVRVDALPLIAYNQIYNDWYRSEFIQDVRKNYKGDGSHSITNSSHSSYVDPTLASRCWPRDYFTSSAPFTQLGDPVTLPIGSTASGPVTLSIGDNNGQILRRGSDGTAIASLGLGDAWGTNADGALNIIGEKTYIDPNGSLTATVSLANATASTVNDVRTAFQLQRILEKKALHGNRYVEYLASSFGVRSPDARLQRAEFLGGGKSPVMISEVLQTSAGTESSPQGNMAGHGFGASRSFSVNKAFTEHGYIMGILSVIPKTSFFQGRKRSLCRWSWTDYYQPEFAHLGEQAVYKAELLCNTTTAGSNTFDYPDNQIFGYQPRYEEYRRRLSEVHGDFRTNMAYWHLARVFAEVPSLNSDFMSCNPSKRIFAAGDQADRPVWVYMNLDVQAIRPIPRHGTPGLVDH